MRFTYPALITSSIMLCRRYKNREHLEEEWSSKVSSILKFVRQLISILGNQVEAPTIALRLFLLAAQVSDECGFEDLTYELYVEAFTIYEESISESRAQLQAIALIIGTLQGARVFGVDNYDTLITKAALHGAKLLKKPHQASAVHLASHMWWQEAPELIDEGEAEAGVEAEGAEPKEAPKSPSLKEKKVDESGEGSRAVRVRDFMPSLVSLGCVQYPHQDSKRVLECLQKSLRIANSATEDIIKTQLYVDTLDKYLFYLDRGALAVRSSSTPKVSSSCPSGHAEVCHAPCRAHHVKH
jgi:vacuolar protein sorting-associated protein 35